MQATLTVVTNGVSAASFHGIHSFVHDGCFEPAGRHSAEPQEPAEARVFWHNYDVGPNSRRDREECARHDGPGAIGSFIRRVYSRLGPGFVECLERSSASTLLGLLIVLLVCKVINVRPESWARAATIAC